MRMAIGLLVVAAACGDDGNMLPIGGGGNDGGFGFPDGTVIDSTGASDAGTDAMVALTDANQFVGRVCLLTDPRVLNVCASTGANGLTVRLGTGIAVTTADGSFTIAGQSGSDLVWRITGPNIVSSFEPLADYFIPAMTTTMYTAIKSANGVIEYPGEGAMMVFVSRNAVGVPDQLASTSREGFYKPFYDGATANDWEQTPEGMPLQGPDTPGGFELWEEEFGVEVVQRNVGLPGPDGIEVSLEGFRQLRVTANRTWETGAGFLRLEELIEFRSTWRDRSHRGCPFVVGR
jgi:hypothetical protein